MGHGHHWRCILPELENGIAHALGWVSQGTVLGQREHPTLQVPGGGVGATVNIIAWPTMGLRATFVVVRDQRSRRAYLHTAFPAAGEGCSHRIRVSSVQEFSCGLEARISGRLGDAALTFFDPLYCLNRDRYRPDALVDVELAGIAYSLKVVPTGTRLQSSVGDVLMDGAAVLLSAAGLHDPSYQNRSCGDEQAFGVAYIQQPAPRVEADDYEFCAPVRDVKQFEIDKIPVSKFRATVMRVRDGRTDIDMDIYATREAMRETAAPITGDEIEGAIWLQGILPPR